MSTCHIFNPFFLLRESHRKTPVTVALKENERLFGDSAVGMVRQQTNSRKFQLHVLCIYTCIQNPHSMCILYTSPLEMDFWVPKLRDFTPSPCIICPMGTLVTCGFVSAFYQPVNLGSHSKYSFPNIRTPCKAGWEGLSESSLRVRTEFYNFGWLAFFLSAVHKEPEDSTQIFSGPAG